ncbi:MAG TPA: ABC transporter substrate-binding protein [Candidatus Saccharimonadales bacterium]|nr:ABC transporter substrate-binding protein [Candidatus Saccharimonadales bacterium]
MRHSFRRKIRHQKRQVESLGTQTEAGLERNLFGRLNNLGRVWRFVAAWLVLFGLLLGCVVAQNQALAGYYTKEGPVPGGIYNEGVVGTITNVNPLYASSDADATVSRLIFASLFRYDENSKLVGDLAQSWKVDDKGTTYTVTLKPNLKWQDGQPLTAHDVEFTYRTIQNPDAQSPLNGSWQNVTVTAVDDHTVTFKLTNPVSSFIYTLTNGIVPEHLLKSIPATDLRSASFNTSSPIGAGPFQWDAIQVKGTDPQSAIIQIALKPYKDYWRGQAKLKSFVVHAYADPQAMIDDFKNHDITAMAGLNAVPNGVKNTDAVVHSLRLNAATMVFFKTSTGILQDTHVRQALVEAIDTSAVLQKLDYPARPVREPLLEGQPGYNAKYAEAEFNPEKAQAELNKAGWKPGNDGMLQKSGQPLSFVLCADDNSEYRIVARELASQWRAIGVDVQLNLQPTQDFKNTLATHEYDAVLHGISIGADPDVFPYWDSSQADIRSATRLNLSEYKSKKADEALEAARARFDPKLREIKLEPFLESWQKDAPALALYQPRYLYITQGEVYGLTAHSINGGVNRLVNVNEWMIRTGRVPDNN